MLYSQLLLAETASAARVSGIYLALGTIPAAPSCLTPPDQAALTTTDMASASAAANRVCEQPVPNMDTTAP